MKNFFLTGLVAILCLNINAYAELRPYIGASFNTFIINGEITATNPSSFLSIPVSANSRDSGSSAGITGGIMLSDQHKINFSHFSGKENSSGILTASVTSISIDYNYNGSGVHRGWFVGAGASTVEIESESYSLNGSSIIEEDSSSASGLLLRGGYGHLFDNNFYLEAGFNLHFAKVELQQTTSDNILVDSTFDVNDLTISLNYVF